MRFVWEEDDVITGRIVAHKGDGEHWLIGFASASRPSDEARYHLISLRDGMVNPAVSKAELAHALNAGQKHPVTLKVTMAEELIRKGMKQ